MRFDSHFDSVIAFSVLAFSVAFFTSVKIVQLVPIIDGWAGLFLFDCGIIMTRVWDF